VDSERVERRAPFGDDQQADGVASGGERLLDWPLAGDQLLVLAEKHARVGRRAGAWRTPCVETPVRARSEAGARPKAGARPIEAALGTRPEIARTVLESARPIAARRPVVEPARPIVA
jgi:hypothetical protein